MSAEEFLERLDGVKERGSGQWLAKCPAHPDKSPSLSMRETDDGTVLLKCWAGCTASEIVHAVGLELRDLFPANGNYHQGPQRQPRISARDLLTLISHRATVLWIAVEDLAAGKSLSEQDLATVRNAYSEINQMLEVASV